MKTLLLLPLLLTPLATPANAFDLCKNVSGFRHCGTDVGNGVTKVYVTHISTSTPVADIVIGCLKTGGTGYDWNWQGKLNYNYISKSDMNEYASAFCDSYLF